MELPSPDLLRAEIAADSLRDFIVEAWPLAESKPFKDNWHIAAICEHLEAVSRGELKRLIINIPPRHMKSLAVAVFWPTWEWLRRPETQFMFASYAQRLTTRDSLKCRRIVEYQGGQREGTLIQRVGYTGLQALIGSRWELVADQREKMKFENTDFGYRLATSIGGTGTGEGGDILVVDDPHKADEVESEVERENVIEWLDGTLSTRLNDPATGRMVLVMQRLHEQDATGHLLEQGGWTHLCLPAEFEAAHPFRWPDDPRTTEGELLWPDHFTAHALQDLKTKLRWRASGQLQQRPAPAEGFMFKRTNMLYWTTEEIGQTVFYVLKDTDGTRHVDGGHVTRFQVADVAASDKTTADYTVIATFLLTKAGDLLVACVERQQFDSLEVHRFLEAANDRQGRPPLWVEEFGAGKGPLRRLRLDGYPAMNLKSDVGIRLDKTARAFHAVAAYEDHKVFHPIDDSSWVGTSVATFENELATFPNASHDDQVDVVSYAARLVPTLRPQDGLVVDRDPGHEPVTRGMMSTQF